MQALVKLQVKGVIIEMTTASRVSRFSGIFKSNESFNPNNFIIRDFSKNTVTDLA